MAIHVPKYEINELSENEATRVKTPAEIIAGVQTEIAKRFMYEPMTDETAEKIREFVRHLTSSQTYGTPDVEIDFMSDLAGKAKECAGCRDTESYEEYRVKRAAAGLSDDAGSEKEWYRMANYSDGSVIVNINFVAPKNVELLEISSKIS